MLSRMTLKERRAARAYKGIGGGGGGVSACTGVAGSQGHIGQMRDRRGTDVGQMWVGVSGCTLSYPHGRTMSSSSSLEGVSSYITMHHHAGIPPPKMKVMTAARKKPWPRHLPAEPS